MDATLNGLVEHFGKALAVRIYACAVIMAESAELTDDEGNYDVAMGARYTIGALKRMRRQATKHCTWNDAIDRLENEQVEGRHYGMAPGPLNLDIKRIETINANDYTSVQNGIVTEVKTGKAYERGVAKEKEIKAVSMVAQVIADESERYNTDPEAQLQARVWVKAYMASVSRTKATFLSKVLADFKAHKEIDRATMRNLSNRYTPDNVKPVDFIELLARYA
jgi:hypothetical protein